MLNHSLAQSISVVASRPQISSIEYSGMNTDPLQLEAQSVLDELMRGGQLPFNLEARRLVSEGSQHTIHFHDSRLRSITVTWEAGQSFKEVIRAAVLDRVSRLSGPLNKKKLSLPSTVIKTDQLPNNS
jgi:hypothetical protein